jgi:hypothetical protein
MKHLLLFALFIGLSPALLKYCPPQTRSNKILKKTISCQ